ncbi:hypothetical protein LRR18_18555, partial [Mangrovimonas sp. AS39]|uniref:hypothetical protein n=1 Tax=Mangrovimonas futianensis TaxID=2895523 RepID=UPI001E5A9359
MMMEKEVYMIKIGDKVETAVFVAGKRFPMHIGIVTSISSDRTLAEVDIMALCKGAAWIVTERID